MRDNIDIDNRPTLAIKSLSARVVFAAAGRNRKIILNVAAVKTIRGCHCRVNAARG